MKLPAWQKKMPKKVTICGRDYSITYSMTDGACFNGERCEILVGCCSTKDVVLDMLVHEISEIVHIELGHRFFNTTTGSNLRFFIDHAQFENHNMLLVAALKDCGLLKIEDN